MVAEEPEPLRERRVVRHAHASLAGRDDLVAIEREAADRAERADAATPALGSVRLRGVLEHGETVPVRDRHDRIHVARMAVQVDRDDGARPGGDPRFEACRIELPGLGIRVREHGRGRAIVNDVRGGHEGQARNDHLVARTDPRGHQRQVERRRPVRDGHAVRDSAEGREVALELPDECAERADPAGAHGLHHVGDLFLADHGRGDGDPGQRHGVTLASARPALDTPERAGLRSAR